MCTGGTPAKYKSRCNCGDHSGIHSTFEFKRVPCNLTVAGANRFRFELCASANSALIGIDSRKLRCSAAGLTYCRHGDQNRNNSDRQSHTTAYSNSAIFAHTCSLLTLVSLLSGTPTGHASSLQGNATASSHCRTCSIQLVADPVMKRVKCSTPHL